MCMQIAGAIIAPVGIIFMLYALWIYKARTQNILRRQAVRYDDQCGPTVLTIVLVIVMLAAYALAVRTAFV